MKNTPRYFEDGRALLAYRDELLEHVRAGRLSYENFRARIKRACARYREDSIAREHYRRTARTQDSLPVRWTLAMVNERNREFWNARKEQQT
jgi:hypothetical protein